MPSATHDSSDRPSPPRCYPGTRTSLRLRVVEWGTNDSRDQRMLWILGPTGVGKSAIAQTIAEEFKEMGHLGATFFFSRPNHRDDPDTVIPTLAYQLATKDYHYKYILTQRLAEDPMLLDKNRRTQFKELIIEPFQFLMTQHKTTTREPLLIILDGLDECGDREAQCEFIELIGSHVRMVDRFPLIWMICSRPEWHFKSMLSDPDLDISCKREEITINNIEAQRDVHRILHADFVKIRKKYNDQFNGDWPPEMHLYRIATAASGHLGFASFVLRFIGDEQYSDPRGQLDVCIKFLGGAGAPGAISPLHALDLLYRRILSDIPISILPNTMRILGLVIFYSNSGLSAQNQANFLYLDQACFYRSLQWLHSVLQIPPVSEAHSTAIRVYHASFSDFLKDPDRSGKFCMDEAAVHYEIAVRSLQWQSSQIPNGTISTTLITIGHNPFPFSPLLACTCMSEIKWTGAQCDCTTALASLTKFSSDVGWDACCRVSDKLAPSLVNRLEEFDFESIRAAPRRFGNFLRWLYCLVSRYLGH